MARSLVLALCALAACDSRDDLDGSRRPPPGLPERAEVYELDLGDRRVAYDLYDNRVAAAVHADGALVIDAGTAAFHPYIEGGYQSPWRVGASDGKRRVGLVDALAGELYLPVDSDTGGVERASDGSMKIAWRARAAAPDQLVSVFLNEQRLTDVAMPSTEWRWYEIRAPASTVVDGENKLRFYFRHAGDIDGVRTAAAFDRIAIGGRPPDEIYEATSVALPSGAMPALATRTEARLSFYADLPADDPALSFAYAGDGRALAIQVRPAGGKAATVWRAEGGADWQRADVDLSAHAGPQGSIARIDLIADGPVAWGRPRITAPAADGDGAERPLPDHVIVWTISSLRPDMIDDHMPNLARFAREGAYAPNLIAAAPAPAPAHVALLTGRYPRGASPPDDAVTLGQRFSAAGYASALVSGNGFVHDDAGFARGFDDYDNPMRRRHPHGADALWQRARQRIAERRDDKTFTYVATVEPHLPWTPSEASLDAVWERTTPVRFKASRSAEVVEAVRNGRWGLNSDDRNFLRALYTASIRDADAALGKLRADLDELGIADRTAVVIVGDHGQELFERGQAGHGYTLYQEVLSTPLVVWYPGAIEPAVIDAPVEAVDVYATVLDLAGISINAGAQGTSLLPRLHGDALPAAAFASLPGRARAVLAGGHKLIVPRYGAHELYVLSRDPGERDDALAARPIAARYLRVLFGLRTAYEGAWNRRRWGTPNRLAPAFAADHGL